MPIRMPGCPHCEDPIFYVHERKFRKGWIIDRNDNSVYRWIPCDGPIDYSASRRLRRSHVRECQRRVVVEQYGSLRPLTNW